MKTLLELRKRVLGTLAHLGWLPPALARLTLGVVFSSTGFGKLQNLDKVTGFFVELGIPAPAFNAALVAWCELLCGGLLLVGLLSRLATVPLVVTMVVAILTAKRSEIHGLADLVGTVEFAYLVLLVAVGIGGPGAASVDAILVQRMDRDRSAGGG
jgi:putative oxidoreductase